jgi:hypothetical protein
VKFVVALISVFFFTGCFQKELSGKIYTIKGDGSIKNAAATQVYLVPYTSADKFLEDLFEAIEKNQLAKQCNAYQKNIVVYNKYVEVSKESDIDCDKPTKNFKKEVANTNKEIEDLKETGRDILATISAYKSSGDNIKVAEFESKFNELDTTFASLQMDLKQLDLEENISKLELLKCDLLKRTEWLRTNASCQSTPQWSELKRKQQDILELHTYLSNYTKMEISSYPYFSGPSDSSYQSERMSFAISFAKEKAIMTTTTDFEGRFRFEDTKTNRAVIVSNYTDSFSNIVWAEEFPTGSAPVELNNRNGVIIKQ